jgi:hypothetical protein
MKGLCATLQARSMAERIQALLERMSTIDMVAASVLDASEVQPCPLNFLVLELTY